MRLLRFMFKVWDYRWLVPLCIAMTIMLPIGIELYGYPSEGWRIGCWVFAPIPTLIVFVGAYVHMVRIHVTMLERTWRDANRQCPKYTERDLHELQRKLSREPWWQD